MLTIRGMNYRQGGELLLEDVALDVYRGHRIGLVGRNGCGKSTLLRVVAGELEPEHGGVSRQPSIRVASVAQELVSGAQSLLDCALDGDAELRALEVTLAAGRHDDAYFAAQSRFEAIAGFGAAARASQLLAGLGFEGGALDRPVESLSGGWRMRLNLARALMGRADLLLLDEPTNHLDLEAIVWLEQYLARYDGALIVVSHDRDFLNGVVNRIAFIEQRRLTLYTGDYDAFEERRAVALAGQQAAHGRQQARIAALTHFVTRFRAKASKARQAQSRLKMLERMERIAAVQVDTSYTLQLPSPDRAPDTLLALDGIGFHYPNGPLLFRDVNLRLAPGDRIALVGPNGAGKSTFVKLLAGALAPTAGERRVGPKVTFGYFAQHQIEQLGREDTPLTYLLSLDPAAGAQALRNYLGRFGFAAVSMDRSVGTLSGGEKSRLVLAGLAWQRPHALLLDEPTNHLDIDMREALMLAVQDYAGALILVSHDRHLIRACADSLWLIADGHADVFSGDLADYQRWAAARQRPARPRPVSSTRRRSVSIPARARQQQRLEGEIQTIEGRLAVIDAALSDPRAYQQGADTVERLTAERSTLARRCGQCEDEWLVLQSVADRQGAGGD
ncbi:MAG: ABC-F family ATP-binding cassette domain-containing protein [Acidiferrobacter sp.]